MNEENINYISSGTLRVPETLPVSLSAQIYDSKKKSSMYHLIYQQKCVSV